jgi:hypothetical protein
VNIFSIVVGVVIQSLSTLELTVQRHFCSILKHQPSPALWRGQAAPRSSRPREVRPRYVRERGFINRRVKMYKAANIAITTRMPSDC